MAFRHGFGGGGSAAFHSGGVKKGAGFGIMPRLTRLPGLGGVMKPPVAAGALARLPGSSYLRRAGVGPKEFNMGHRKGGI